MALLELEGSTHRKWAGRSAAETEAVDWRRDGMLRGESRTVGVGHRCYLQRAPG